MVLLVGLWSVIVVGPDHTHLVFVSFCKLCNHLTGCFTLIVLLLSVVHSVSLSCGAVGWSGLRSVIVVFPGHTRVLFFK